MAIVTLRIPDDTFEKYQKMNPANPSHAMEAQLKRFEALSHKDRALIVPPEERREIEAVYGQAIESIPLFVKWLKSLVSITIGGFEFTLKAGQRKKLEGLAKFRQRTYDDYTKMHLGRILDADLGTF